MDYGKAISFITEDPRWVTKVAIGTALILASMILSPILIGLVGYVILGGYAVRLYQNVRDGATYPLPEWDQWGDDLVRGFKLAVVVIVWALPLIFLAIPFGIGSAMSDGRGAGQSLGILITLCTGCLTFIYGLFFYLVSPGFLIWFAEDEQISSGLQFTEIWAWTQAHIGQVILAILVVIIVSFALQLASMLGLILCLVGVIVTIPLATLATTIYTSHIYGQLARLFPTGHRPAYAEPMPTPPMPTPADVAVTSAVVTPPPAPIVPVEETPAPAPEPTDVATTLPPSEEPPAPAAPDEETPPPPVA